MAWRREGGWLINQLCGWSPEGAREKGDAGGTDSAFLESTDLSLMST